MTDPVLLPGPVRVECPCECGAFGVLRRKTWADGLRHTRNCACKRYCEASRFTRRAKRREQRIAKDLGGERQPFSGALSGADVKAGMWSFEETSNEMVVRGFRRWWTSKGITRKLARLFARHGEAHALILSWEGKPRVVIAPYDDFAGQFPVQLDTPVRCAGSGFSPRRTYRNTWKGNCSACGHLVALDTALDGGSGPVMAAHDTTGREAS